MLSKIPRFARNDKTYIEMTGLAEIEKSLDKAVLAAVEEIRELSGRKS